MLESGENMEEYSVGVRGVFSWSSLSDRGGGCEG